jgi:hypothetical protein
VKIKLESKQGVEVLADTLDSSLDALHEHDPSMDPKVAALLQRQSFNSLKERVLTCLVHNTAVPGGIRAPGDFNAKAVAGPGSLHEHINSLKLIVDKQRATVPALVLKQTTTHLEQLQSFDGALLDIEEMRRTTQELARSHGAAAVDVQKDLLAKCDALPELQRRLQTATAKLGTILSQMDAQAPSGIR